MATKEITTQAGSGLIRFVLDLGEGDSAAVPAGALAELLGVVDRRWRRRNPDGPDLLVRDIRRGSIIIELGLAAAAALAAASNFNSLFDFAKNIEGSFARLKGWKRGEPLAPEDYELGRALSALTRAGLSVTLSAAAPQHGSVYARVSPHSLDDLSKHIEMIEGPDPIHLPAALPVRRNVRLYVVAQGEGELAFIPEVDPRALPFTGVEAPRDLPTPPAAMPFGLAANVLPAYVMASVVAPSGADDFFGATKPSTPLRTDLALRGDHAHGACFLVDVQVQPGPKGSELYIVLQVKQRL